MLNPQEFDDWCRQISLSQEARSIIEQIRSREPIRRVKSSGINVRGDYPSRKMGKTIQFESHKVELPGIEEYEEDSDVLEYYDQPYQFILEWKSNSGKIVRASHIPDFFVLRTQCAGFEEWKPETRLEKLAAKQPQRYLCTEDGRSKEEAEQGLRRFRQESSFFEQPYSREHHPKRAPITEILHSLHKYLIKGVRC